MNLDKSITQNSEARVVDQDIASYELAQESLAMLKVLALGKAEIDEGKTILVKKAFSNMRRNNAFLII